METFHPDSDVCVSTCDPVPCCDSLQAVPGPHRRGQLHRHLQRRHQAVDGGPGQHGPVLGPEGGPAAPAARLHLTGVDRHTDTGTHRYTQMDAHTKRQMDKQTDTSMLTHSLARKQTHARTHTHTHRHTHTHTHTYMRARTHTETHSRPHQYYSGEAHYRCVQSVVGARQCNSLRHVLSVKSRRKFTHSSSWLPLPLQLHHGETVQLE